MPIELRQVEYTYGPGTPFEKQALRDINVTIEDGQFLGIIGHTGSGKSTFVQLLNGLLHPTSGQVAINGVDIAKKGAEAKVMRRKVGMVFQYPEHQLFVGLDYDTCADRSPFHLSGGQMRRVAIAGVIALRPDYLILDEPSAGLDPSGRDEIFGQIKRLHEEEGITVIIVSHNMDDISRLADRLLVFNQGSVLLDGQPMDIFINHREELQEAGVDLPPVSITVEHLRSRGLMVDNHVLMVKDALAAIEKEVDHVK